MDVNHVSGVTGVRKVELSALLTANSDKDQPKANIQNKDILNIGDGHGEFEYLKAHLGRISPLSRYPDSDAGVADSLSPEDYDKGLTQLATVIASII